MNPANRQRDLRINCLAQPPRELIFNQLSRRDFKSMIYKQYEGNHNYQLGRAKMDQGTKSIYVVIIIYSD